MHWLWLCVLAPVSLSFAGGFVQGPIETGIADEIAAATGLPPETLYRAVIRSEPEAVVKALTYARTASPSILAASEDHLLKGSLQACRQDGEAPAGCDRRQEKIRREFAELRRLGGATARPAQLYFAAAVYLHAVTVDVLAKSRSRVLRECKAASQICARDLAPLANANFAIRTLSECARQRMLGHPQSANRCAGLAGRIFEPRN